MPVLRRRLDQWLAATQGGVYKEVRNKDKIKRLRAMAEEALTRQVFVVSPRGNKEQTLPLGEFAYAN